MQLNLNNSSISNLGTRGWVFPVPRAKAFWHAGLYAGSASHPIWPPFCLPFASRESLRARKVHEAKITPPYQSRVGKALAPPRGVGVHGKFLGWKGFARSHVLGWALFLASLTKTISSREKA